MGFGINNFDNKPIIRGAQSSQDGGAGNLGYFEREEKKRKEEDEQSVFAHSEDVDSFSKHSEDSELENDISFSKIIADIIFNVKHWFLTILGIKH